MSNTHGRMWNPAAKLNEFNYARGVVNSAKNYLPFYTF